MKNIRSWGNYPKQEHSSVFALSNDIFSKSDKSFLAHGLGRSYGDVCLNENENIIDSRNQKKILNINEVSGQLSVDSGASIREVLNVTIPKGWFLPVVPGTQNVTIGGAIANDIHGKNHHKSGSFGNFVESFSLLRSTGEIINCSETENKELFSATIGGLGLTGVIISSVINLKKIDGSFINSEIKRFRSLDEYWELNNSNENKYEYTVCWVDCLSKTTRDLRGIYISGDHSRKKTIKKNRGERNISFPITPPFSLVNNYSMKMINNIYYYGNKDKKISNQHYRSFFFPLDVIQSWNKAYGTDGFFQYQFVVPKNESEISLNKIIQEIQTNGQIPALGVLKSFGSIKSKGMLSFPREGITMALDFANKGLETLKFLDRLDKIVMEYGGALYPAKDARMSKDVFSKSFKNINDFQTYVDPRFSSSFYRRVK